MAHKTFSRQSHYPVTSPSLSPVFAQILPYFGPPPLCYIGAWRRPNRVNTTTQYVWPVFGFAQCKFYAKMWSQQPNEWAKRPTKEEKWPYYGYFWAKGVDLWRRDSYNMNIYGTCDLVQFWATLDVWKYHFLRTPSIVWPGASKVPAPLDKNFNVENNVKTPKWNLLR